METRKIALACFVGGAFCAAAFIFLPLRLMWLSIVTGLAAGYISYDFREVLTATPKAFKAAFSTLHKIILNILQRIEGRYQLIVSWFKKPQPFTYAAIALILPWYLYLCHITYLPLLNTILYVDASLWQMLWKSLLIIGLYCTVYMAIFAFFKSFLQATAYIGAESEKKYWIPLLFAEGKKDERERIKKLRKNGFKRKVLTYKVAYSWLWLGIKVLLNQLATFLEKIFTFLFRDFWLGAGKVCMAILKFFIILIRLIHSRKRVLCAIDGTIGGIASYIWLASPPLSTMDIIGIILAGGIIGTAIGVLNWEIVSIRIFGIEPTKNS